MMIFMIRDSGPAEIGQFVNSAKGLRRTSRRSFFPFDIKYAAIHALFLYDRDLYYNNIFERCRFADAEGPLSFMKT